MHLQGRILGVCQRLNYLISSRDVNYILFRHLEENARCKQTRKVNIAKLGWGNRDSFYFLSLSRSLSLSSCSGITINRQTRVNFRSRKNTKCTFLKPVRMTQSIGINKVIATTKDIIKEKQARRRYILKSVKMATIRYF